MRLRHRVRSKGLSHHDLHMQARLVSSDETSPLRNRLRFGAGLELTLWGEHRVKVLSTPL